LPFIKNVRRAKQKEFWSIYSVLTGGYDPNLPSQNMYASIHTFDKEKALEAHPPNEAAYFNDSIARRNFKWTQISNEGLFLQPITPSFNENIHVHYQNYLINSAGPNSSNKYRYHPPYTGYKGDISGPKKFGGRSTTITRFNINPIEGEKILIGNAYQQFGGFRYQCVLEAKKDRGKIWGCGRAGPFRDAGFYIPETFLGNSSFAYDMADRTIDFAAGKDHTIEIRVCLHDGYGLWYKDFLDPWRRTYPEVEGDFDAMFFTSNIPGYGSGFYRPIWNTCIVYLNGFAIYCFYGPENIPITAQTTSVPNIACNESVYTPKYPYYTYPEWYGNPDGWFNQQVGSGTKVWSGVNYILNYELNGPTKDETPYLKTMDDPYPESGYEICEFTKPHKDRRFFVDTIGSTDIVCRPQRFIPDTPSTFKKSGAYYTQLVSFEKPNFKTTGTFPQYDGYIDFVFYQLSLRGSSSLATFSIYWRSATVVDPENPYAGFTQYFSSDASFGYGNIIWDDWGPSPGGTRTGKLYVSSKPPTSHPGGLIYELYFGSNITLDVTLSR